MQKGFTLWLTGLPCSGKTVIGDLVAKELKKRGLRVERLDGDIVRKSLTKDLGFSKEDRYKNIERVTFVAKLLTRNGVIVIASFVSPYNEVRERSRREIGNYVLVYVKCPLEECIKRDSKGMYEKAIAGEIQNFTGISDPFEEPINPEIIVETDKESPDECKDKI
ncbi:MAG: adenylyl-sulfate kinase, partial [Candidatus Hodarchaeota archaeon]